MSHTSHGQKPVAQQQASVTAENFVLGRIVGFSQGVAAIAFVLDTRVYCHASKFRHVEWKDSRLVYDDFRKRGVEDPVKGDDVAIILRSSSKGPEAAVWVPMQLWNQAMLKMAMAKFPIAPAPQEAKREELPKPQPQPQPQPVVKAPPPPKSARRTPWVNRTPTAVDPTTVDVLTEDKNMLEHALVSTEASATTTSRAQ